MKHVSVNSIEKAIDKVDNLDDNGLERIAETYSLAQENLLGYVLTAAEEYNNPDLEGLIIYYFCLISEAFTQEGIQLNKVENEMIEQFEDEYFEILDEYFDKENDEVLQEFVDQPEIIQFMLMEITVADDDGTQMDDETATQLFIVVMAFTTLMNRAIK